MLCGCVQELQSEIADRLQVLSDLKVQCERLCDAETLAKADAMRMRLVTLEDDIPSFQRETADKHDHLKVNRLNILYVIVTSL